MVFNNVGDVSEEIVIQHDALVLTKDFDLSGGEIENIVRKHTVNSILTRSNKIDLEFIRKSSQEERMKKINKPRVGF